jgi:death-on-curing family protein
LFSSYYYYELTEEQIASIINALIKNHCFLDANKRTAFLTFISICNINNITNIKDKSQYATIFENIAANHYTVQEVAKLLFTKI